MHPNKSPLHLTLAPLLSPPPPRPAASALQHLMDEGSQLDEIYAVCDECVSLGHRLGASEWLPPPRACGLFRVFEAAPGPAPLRWQLRAAASFGGASAGRGVQSV